MTERVPLRDRPEPPHGPAEAPHESPDDRPVPLGDSPLYHRLLERAPGFASRVVTRVVDEVPFYRRLPAEERDRDLTGIVEQGLRIALRALELGRPPAAEDLTGLTRSAVRRAQERIPLPAVLSAYHVASRLVWTELVAEAGPDELSQVGSASELLLHGLQIVTEAVAAAYLDEWEAVIEEDRHRHRSLTDALLRGEPVPDTHRFGDRPAPSAYHVLAVAIEPRDQPPEVDEVVTGRRRVRRLLAAVRRYTGATALSTLQPGGGILLLPCDVPAATLDALPARLTEVTAAAVTVAVATAEPGYVKRAAQQAREVLEVVRRFGKPPGLYRLCDVLLEYQLTRESPARDALAALLRPLDARPELLQTLTVFVEQDLNRRRTASVLHLHPNTIDYRLRRAADLTGLNPTVPTELHRIVAALTARRAEPASAHPAPRRA